MFHVLYCSVLLLQFPRPSEYYKAIAQKEINQELTSLEYISKDKNPSEREVYLPITKIDIRIMMADLSDGRTCIVPRIVLQCTALAVSKTF